MHRKSNLGIGGEKKQRFNNDTIKADDRGVGVNLPLLPSAAVGQTSADNSRRHERIRAAASRVAVSGHVLLIHRLA